MPYLLATTALLATIGLVNVALTLGVIRQLRTQRELLAGGLAVPAFEPPMLPAGATIAEFRATTVDGQVVSNTDLGLGTLVGFLTPGCPACLESLPWFLRRAEAAGQRDQVLAVISGAGADQTDMCRRLAEVARVVVEEERGAVAQAFGVQNYPAFALMSGDTVVASHFVLDQIPETVPRQR